MSAKTMNFTLPEDMRGSTLQWYFDKDATIAKIVIDTDGQHGASKTVTVPKKIRIAFEKESNYLLFKTVKAIYIGSYRKGKEAFEKFLKKDGITLFE